MYLYSIEDSHGTIASLHLLSQVPTPQQRERYGSGKLTIRGTLKKVVGNISSGNKKMPTIHLGLGDPSVFPCFRASVDAEDAVVSALRSAHYNCYGPLGGILQARR
ncbi:hypothetical protein ACLOJK_009814 [Asimina triloba]